MKNTKSFYQIQRQEIPRRSVGVRKTDWKEVDQTPDFQMMAQQAERCMDCGVPFCQSETGCPVDNDIPDWNQLTSQGRLHEALTRLQATNNFPEMTGRLCPAPCESACVLGLRSDPVNIRAIEWGLVEEGFRQGWIQPKPAVKKTERKIAIIGSGPAGLAAAQQLARQGHSVTVFEKERQAGGLLRYGIPDFKLQKSWVDRRLTQLQAEGVELKTSTCLGKDFDYQDLQKNFEVVALAMGAEKPRDLLVPGRELRGIHLAMDYLKDQNRFFSGESQDLQINARGKRVVILGGGDTGSDCLGTALRQEALSVVQFEIQAQPSELRSEKTPWPFWPMKLKVSHAHEEGGSRQWSFSTEAFLGSGGRVEKLAVRKLGDKGSDSLMTWEADLVFLALGFTGIQRDYLKSIPNLKISENGRIQTDQFQTSEPGVFACGDSQRGASLIVWAIAEGRKMATAIEAYLAKEK
ncbi:MAG: glutamate synthase subunit beta [Pseudobdellovibrionaceae bacterium]